MNLFFYLLSLHLTGNVPVLLPCKQKTNMRKPMFRKASLPLWGLLLGITLSSFECTGNNGMPAVGEATSKEAAAPVQVESSGPRPGKWEAVVSNGYKGDVLTFTVSADGKRVENVEFKGHWRSRSSRTEVLQHLDPPKPFDISKNAFSAVQREEDASMWWEFIGDFTSATTAEGSYRCTFAGGENDTYKLKWTAKRVGL
jgi:hypothetical protein